MVFSWHVLPAEHRTVNALKDVAGSVDKKDAIKISLAKGKLVYTMPTQRNSTRLNVSMILPQSHGLTFKGLNPQNLMT